MDEEKKEVTEVTEEKSVVTLDDLSADELRSIVRETRSEAKTYRVSLRELQKKQEQLDADKRKEEEDKLKQKGEYQKLLDAKEKEFEAIKPKADAFDELRLSEIEEAKKSLGEKWLDEYANLSLPTLRKTVTALKAQLISIPSTDNGGGGDPPVITLTADQKKAAKDRGLTEEEYAEILKRHKEIKADNENKMKW